MSRLGTLARRFRGRSRPDSAIATLAVGSTCPDDGGVSPCRDRQPATPVSPLPARHAGPVRGQDGTPDQASTPSGLPPLYVARPHMPDLDALHGLLGQIWDSGRVTNEGPMHDRLEAALAAHLGVRVAKVFSSGTSALQCALLASGFAPGSEIITTPLTFAATAHAIATCGFVPVFADIDPVTLTLDPAAVERAITDRTVAVLPVHVYGTICDDDALQALCARNGLSLIYDAAHAFSARRKDRPVAAMGDLSVFSLHATKPFHTIEGGLVTTNDTAMADRLRRSRNFGMQSAGEVQDIGINAKLSELHAAVGLLNLEGYASEKVARRSLRRAYADALSDMPGISFQVDQPDVEQSEHWFMIRVDAEVFGVSRDRLHRILCDRNIFSRRYFWPICTDFDCYRDHRFVSNSAVSVADRVKDTLLCLPFHSGVTADHLAVIREAFAQALHEGRSVGA